MSEHHQRTRPLPGNALDILGSYRRRVLLAVVSETDGPIPRQVLAARVAAADHGKPIDDVTESERKESAVRLHHVDLPRLGAAGLIQYDTENGLVRSGDLPLEGDEWLEMPVVEALEAWNSPR